MEMADGVLHTATCCQITPSDSLRTGVGTTNQSILPGTMAATTNSMPRLSAPSIGVVRKTQPEVLAMFNSGFMPGQASSPQRFCRGGFAGSQRTHVSMV